MPHNLTTDDITQTLAALCGTYALDVGQTVRAIGVSLPGKAVCAILPDIGDGITRIVLDLDKPHALAHTRAMIREWWESTTVETAHQFPPTPRRHPQEPLALAIAGS